VHSSHICMGLWYVPGNNNNNNTRDSVYGAAIMHDRSHFESSPDSSDECNVGQRQAAADPQTRLTDLSCESVCIGCYMAYIHHHL